MGFRSFFAGLVGRSDDPVSAAAGVRTLHEDFEDVVRGRTAVLLSPLRPTPTPASPSPGTAAVPRSVDLGDGIGFELGIVGESFYDVELKRIASQQQPGASLEFTVTLMPEPANPADKNAIVVLSDRGAPIGYLSRQSAVEYGPVFAALAAHGHIAQCNAKMFGGTDAKRNVGVWLDIDPAERLLARLTTDPTSMRLPSQPPSGRLDPVDGQPVNTRLNRAERVERDLSEFLGLAKGVLADGVVNDAEAQRTKQWVGAHPDAADRWPLSALVQRLDQVFADGEVSEEERVDLAELLRTLIGGTADVVDADGDTATALPLDTPPPPVFAWSDAVYVFTGTFARRTRAECEREVVRRGGVCSDRITKKTTYLVIGTFGSRDWAHSAFGRKIEKAVYYRSNGQQLFIVSERHWDATITAA